MLEPWRFDRSFVAASATSSYPVVVGTLAQPYFSHENGTTITEHQFIAASYVKWIEMGGGRSIPIPYDMTSDTVLDEIFAQIHGILLPGGNNSTLPYAVQYLLQKSMERNVQGNYFPIWGMCLGFEMIIQSIGRASSVLQNNFNSTNISLPLILLDSKDHNNDAHQAVRRRRQSRPFTTATTNIQKVSCMLHRTFIIV